MYQDELEDPTDFWRGYDSPAYSPMPHKASFTHIESVPIPSSMGVPLSKPSVPSVLVTPSQLSTTTTRESIPAAPAPPMTHPEDSYWAQYSSVHGSGDSTVPSPRLENGRKPAPADEYGRPALSSAEENVDDARSQQNVLFEYKESPMRRDAYLRGAVGADEEFAEDAYGRGFDDAFAHTELAKLEGHVLGLTMEEMEKSPTIASSVSSGEDSTSTSSDTALEDTIRGIYCLWRGQNPHRTMEHFLAVVKQAVEP